MKLTKKFKSLLAFPPPTSYGADNDYALPIDDFKNTDNDYTWEMYYKDVKKDFPIKYFIVKLIPEVINDITFPVRSRIKDGIYFIKSHVIPSRRYHLLSLVQPKSGTNDDYTYGWIDSDHQMIFACMNILVSFIEEEYGIEEFKNHLEFLRSEVVKYNLLTDEQKRMEWSCEQNLTAHQKMFDIYNWWKVDRKNILKKYDNDLTYWHNNRKTPIGNELHKNLNILEAEIKEKEQEMLIDLINVREFMWT